MTSIADRASTAHHQAQRLPAPASTAADIARTTVRLAVLLGIGPEHVRPEWPWQHSARTTPPYPLTLHVTDPAAQGDEYAFRYRDPLYNDEPYLLLALCRHCHGSVAEIRDLADLATHLRRGPTPTPHDGPPPDSLPDQFATDPGHARNCRFGPPE